MGQARGDRDLHRAGHRERLMTVNADRLAGRQVERGDAEVTRAFPRADREPLFKLLKLNGLRSKRRLRSEKGREQYSKAQYPHHRSIQLT